MNQPGATTTQKRLETKSRNAMLKEIREHVGPNTPQTLLLIVSLIVAWDMIDLLTKIFNAELAQAYLQAGFEAVEGTNDDNE